jgi:hypothetical protein
VPRASRKPEQSPEPEVSQDHKKPWFADLHGKSSASHLLETSGGVLLARRASFLPLIFAIALFSATGIHESDFKNFDYAWDAPKLGVTEEADINCSSYRRKARFFGFRNARGHISGNDAYISPGGPPD